MFRRAFLSSADDPGKYTVGFIPEADEEVKMAVRQRNIVDDIEDPYTSDHALVSDLLQPNSPGHHDECGSAHSSISI